MNRKTPISFLSKEFLGKKGKPPRKGVDAQCTTLSDGSTPRCSWKRVCRLFGVLHRLMRSGPQTGSATAGIGSPKLYAVAIASRSSLLVTVGSQSENLPQEANIGDESRPEFYAALQVLQGLAGPDESEEGDAEVLVGGGVVGRMFQSGPVRFGGPGEESSLEEYIADIVVRLGLAGIDPDRLPVQYESLLEFPCLGPAQADVHQGGDIGRVKAQDLLPTVHVCPGIVLYTGGGQKTPGPEAEHR